MSEPVESVQDMISTGCVVVGGGPGGMMLAYLLARKGVDVTLLESHTDFDRDFRGDTIHPSTLELIDRLGLMAKLQQIPHTQARVVRIYSGDTVHTMADFDQVRCKYPYVMMMPQVKFLDFLAAEAQALPSFRLVLGANVQRLIEENGVICGVRYRDTDNHWHEVRAPLVVAADGRHSKVRALVGAEQVKTAPPMDVLWFRLSKLPGETHGDEVRFLIDRGEFLIQLERDDNWQLGYVYLKGGYSQIKGEGIAAFRERVAQLVPTMRERLDADLPDWKSCAVLSVESGRLPVWHRPGLLFIGDAAHTMSPVGGVGINYAIQDAIEAANRLAEPLKAGRVTRPHLAEVQRQREWPVKVMQWVQGQIQKQIVAQALKPGPFRLPLPARLATATPGLRWLLPTMLGWGVKPARWKG